MLFVFDSFDLHSIEKYTMQLKVPANLHQRKVLERKRRFVSAKQNNTASSKRVTPYNYAYNNTIINRHFTNSNM